MEEAEDKRVVIRFPRELADELTALAERERRSLNAQVIYMLERAVESYRRRMGREAEDEETRSPALVAA
jgi:hypothetical protein